MAKENMQCASTIRTKESVGNAKCNVPVQYRPKRMGVERTGDQCGCWFTLPMEPNGKHLDNPQELCNSQVSFFCFCGNWPTNSIQLFRRIGIAFVKIYEFLIFLAELITSDVDQIKSRSVTFCTNDII